MIRAQHPVSFAHRLVASAAPVSDRLMLIGGSDRNERCDKNAYIKKCSLVSVAPETLETNVKAGTIFGVSSGICECFTHEWL